MERQNRELQYKTLRREELHRVIEKIRNTPNKQPEDQPRPSKVFQLEEPPDENKSLDVFETESTSSNNSIDVPAINFKRYLGATEVRYIQMGRASHNQVDNPWDLAETARQAEQKFTTDLKTIAAETTEEAKFLKTLVC